MQTYKESLPLYRHKELYEWNEQYQTHKFFADKDFEDERRIEELKSKGHFDCGNEDYPPMLDDYSWRYEHRYSALKQNTVFFRNLLKLETIRYDVESYSEYVLKAAIHGIEQKFVNFELLYTWFARRRSFSFNYWDDNYEPNPDDGYDQWLKFCEMRKEAFNNGHLNCCKYSEFIEHEFK